MQKQVLVWCVVRYTICCSRIKRPPVTVAIDCLETFKKLRVLFFWEVVDFKFAALLNKKSSTDAFLGGFGIFWQQTGGVSRALSKVSGASKYASDNFISSPWETLELMLKVQIVPCCITRQPT